MFLLSLTHVVTATWRTYKTFDQAEEGQRVRIAEGRAIRKLVDGTQGTFESGFGWDEDDFSKIKWDNPKHKLKAVPWKVFSQPMQ